jgi:hypothetical protein
MIREVMKDVRIVLLSNKRKIFVRVGERLIALWSCLIYLPNLKNIICKWLYSPDTKSFRFCSALNPDSSICMNCSDSPWLFAVCGLYFAEDTFIKPIVLYLQPCNHSQYV